MIVPTATARASHFELLVILVGEVSFGQLPRFGESWGSQQDARYFLTGQVC
jgi:hypothetical protein